MTGETQIASVAPAPANQPPAHFAADMDAGPQPLDRQMHELGLDNHALVAKSTEHLTHKEVQKARRGRKLTARTQARIARAFAAAAGRTCPVTDLFNYAGR